MGVMDECVKSLIAKAESQTQEDSWVAASQGGDPLAFNRLVLKWEQTIYNVALRILQDREEATEAAQEIFILAFRNIRLFRRNCKFSTWLYRIAINHCNSRLKQRPSGVHLSLDDPKTVELPARQLSVSETQASAMIQSEQKHKVHTALSHLPPDQRSVVELKFFQELTFEEIAAILEIPLSTIKSRLYAALEMLKVRLNASL
jgi:RNA polymerase sigma-70 factor, ECF subfamily